MKQQFVITLSILVLVTTSCNPQSNIADKLLGTWELIESDQQIILYFQENEILDLQQNGIPYKAKYFLLSDSILIMGTSVYKILSYSDTDLLIESKSFFREKYHYKKTDKTILPIKEYETLSFTYPNGQKKLEGQYHNGIRDGKWTEWFENGQIKSIENFIDGIPFGLQELWYENGQKKEEIIYDFQMEIMLEKYWDESGKLLKEK